MRKLYILIFFLFASTSQSFGQGMQLSTYSEVSIFTLGPGDALFETFGHNAIRIKDPLLKMDLIFNYGTFDFRDPNFYANFAKGRLEYWVSVSKYENFEASYKYQQRWAKEQILDLTHQEKQEFFNFLENNVRLENRSYLYDPYYDNCSTKLRDITKQILKDKVQFSTDYMESKLSLRQVMNHELPWNTWGSFGINVALGSKLDKIMTADEYVYLPDYLYLAFKDAQKMENGISKPLVKEEKTILDYEERAFKIDWYNPLLIFSFLFLFIAYITYKDIKRNRRSVWVDFTIFFFTGIVGILIVFLWFFTDHKTAPNNFNVLWAFAPNVILAFFLLKRNVPKWVMYYVRTLFFLPLVLLLIWFTGIQLLTMAYLPLLAILFVRYGYLSRLLTSKE